MEVDQLRHYPTRPRVFGFGGLLGLALLTVAVAACGGGDASPANGVGARLSGVVEIDGSSTVFPVTEAVAEEFHNLHSKVQVNVGVSGTGGGFKRFTDGDTDVSNASRLMKDGEVAAAAANGVEYLELKVALDGLSVVVNPSNDFVECLTVEELRRIWEPGSGIKTWDQVRPEFPDRKISLYGPGTDSGTFDYFTEEIVGEVQASRADYTASEDDNVLVLGVSGDRNSLGYFGYAYYIENSDKVRALGVDAGAGCVLPTRETIEAGEYVPLSRPLYIYVNAESLGRPEVVAFVEFYMDNAAELAAEVGYIGLSEAEYSANIDAIK
jgi:phosphate transport system substrate-binding protein